MKIKFLILTCLFALLAGKTVAQSQLDKCSGSTPGADQAGCGASGVQPTGVNGILNPDDPRDGDAGNGDKNSQNNNSSDPLNTFSGDAWETIEDFNYNRVGFPLRFERSFHNGISSSFYEMGMNWMSNYDMWLNVPIEVNNNPFLPYIPDTDPKMVTLEMPHHLWQFTSTDGINFTPPPGCFYHLVRSGNVYLLTDKFGAVYKFSLALGGAPNVAKLIEIDDLNGNHVNLTYETWMPAYTLTGLGVVTISGRISLRLKRVDGPNWFINFVYHDSGPYSDNYSNPNGFRLKQVQNSVGDTISFNLQDPSELPIAPVTQVLRTPSGLNASYQYNLHNYFKPSVSNTAFTLSHVVDPLRPKGFKDTTYVSPIPNPAPPFPGDIRYPIHQVINGNGQVTHEYSYGFDGNGNKLTTVNRPGGLFETDVYDTNGNWAERRFALDGQLVTEFYTWNANRLMTQKVDGNGHSQLMDYDALGNLLYQKDAENYEEFFTYNGISRLQTSQDKNQVRRGFEFSPEGNLLGVYELLGRETHFTYYANGLIHQLTDANSHTTTYTYDSNGNLTSIKEPDLGPPANQSGALTHFVFDSRGHLQSKTDALSQPTNFVFAANQKWLQDINCADGTNQHFEYDAVGNMTLSRDKNLVQNKFYYDLADNMVDSYEAFGTSDVKHNHFDYDAAGNITALTDNKSQRTVLTYNEQNLLKSSLDSLNKGFFNSYDGALNLHTRTDTKGVVRTMGYFQNDRLQTMQFSDGTPSISFTYDGNGNQKTMTDGIGLKTFDYDVLNRLLTMTDVARNFQLIYTYDLLGNRLSMTNNKVPGVVSYGYYENNLSKAVTDTDGMATTFIYDPMKNLKNIYYPNGSNALYDYVPTNHRLTSLQNLTSHGEILSSFTYDYDNAGNQMAVTDLTGPTSFVYDNLGQLRSVTFSGPQGFVGYGYDGVGNRTSLNQNGNTQTLGYNSGNEITDGLGESFTHDLAGNMTQRGSTTYAWDGLNRLMSVSSTAGTVNYLYDGDNHRVKKISGTETTNYFYDNLSPLLEADGSGVVQKIYNPGIGFKTQGGEKLFYLRNGHGDVAGLMDTKENLVQDYSYDAFGKTLGTQGDPNGSRYVGLAGVFSDDDVNLQYMWNRWYDPKLGRFITRDPINLEGGFNLYGYSKNNPFKWIDPDGKNQIYFVAIPMLSTLGAGLQNFGSYLRPYFGEVGPKLVELGNFTNERGDMLERAGDDFSEMIIRAKDNFVDQFKQPFDPPSVEFQNQKQQVNFLMGVLGSAVAPLGVDQYGNIQVMSPYSQSVVPIQCLQAQYNAADYAKFLRSCHGG